MTRASNSNFTRGAQLWAHNIRMILQGVRNVCIFGIAFVLGLWVMRISGYMTFSTFYYFVIERIVWAKLEIGAFFYPKGEIGITFFSLEQQRFIARNALDFEHKFWHVTKHGDVVRGFFDWVVTHALMESILAFGMFTAFAFCMIITFTCPFLRTGVNKCCVLLIPRVTNLSICLM